MVKIFLIVGGIYLLLAAITIHAYATAEDNPHDKTDHWGN